MLVDPSGRPVQSEPRQPSAAMARIDHAITEQNFDTWLRLAGAPAARTLVQFIDGAMRHKRQDRWVNTLTGVGTLADKTRAGFFDAVFRIPDQELTNLVNGSDLAAKVVEKRPKEMFRRGFDLKSNEGPTKDKVSQSDIADFRDWCTEKLLLENRLRQGLIFGRQYGGALAILGVDDGQEMIEPLDETKIKGFSFINVIDRRFAWVNSYYGNPREAKFGEPESYIVSNGVAAQDYRPMKAKAVEKRGWSIVEVHESRVIRFGGVETDMLTRQTLAGWSWSVLQRAYEVLRQFDHGFDSATYLLSDASQGIFKLKGLLAAISSGNKNAIEQRMLAIEETRSVIRGVALDADKNSGEDFTRVQTPMTGIPDMLDRLMQRFSAAADMPVQELFGAGAGGLNAAGEAQAATRKWYDTIATEQVDELAPKLARVFRLAALSGSSPLGKKDVRWNIAFHPLWSPTDDELAKTRFTDAQRDALYIENGVVSSEQVALRPGMKDIYPAIDEEKLEAAVKAMETFDPHANDPQLVPQKTPMVRGSAALAASTRGGEQAVPGIPLPGPGPGNSGSAAAGGSSMNLRQDKKSRMIAEAVHDQLSQDYSKPETISWVKAAKWKGPGRVPLSRIDYTNKGSWSAAHDDAKVSFHAQRIGQGIEKPIILVKTPHSAKLNIVDGHHRGLAYLSLDKSPKAYVATVDAAHGPWDAMHATQKETGLEASTQSKTQDAADFVREAAIGIIFNASKQKILAARTVGDDWRSKVWGMPGGALDEGESVEAALRREILEETGLSVEAAEPVAITESPVDGRRVHVWLVTKWSGTPKPDGKEIAELSWMSPNALLTRSGKFTSSVQALMPEIEKARARADAIDIKDLPADFGVKVPTEGSHCSNCRFLAQDKPPMCDNATFIKWLSRKQGHDAKDVVRIAIPAPDEDAKRYCCSAWQLKDGPKGDGGVRQDDGPPDEPRDESGKWTAGGGSASGASPKAGSSGAGAEYRVHTAGRSGAIRSGGKKFEVHALTPQGWKPTGASFPTYSEAEAHAASLRGAGPASAAGGRTWVTKSPVDYHYESGHPTPERQHLHDQIVHDVLDRVKPVEPGHQKLAIFTMGGPGSGKSSALRGIDKTKFVHIDPDALKERIPEYQQATHPSHTFTGAAKMVHPESRDIARQLRTAAMAKGAHIIVDGTGADADSVIRKMREAKANGYTVRLSYTHLGDTDEAMRRVHDRAEKTGRVVPDEFARKAYETIPRNFDKIAAEANTFTVRDSSRQGSPIVWEKGSDGLERTADPAFREHFKSQYGHANAPRAADPKEFKSAFDKAFDGSPFTNHVTHYGEKELAGMKTLLSGDGKTGVAVHDHGDGRVEATALFNVGAKGEGLRMLDHAIKTAGVNYVECYGPDLPKMYSKLGFEVESKTPFNREYAAAGWDYDRFPPETTDYYTMRLKK